jgi:hypothetical protein
MDNTVKSRKSERNVGLILPHSVLAAEITEKTSDTSLVTLQYSEILKIIYKTYLPAISWNVLVMMKSV